MTETATVNRAPRVALTIATWFGCGYFPGAPGTVASVAAIVLAVALVSYARWSPWHFGILAAAAILPGVWAAGRASAHLARKDPGCVVVDEVIGQWLSLAGATTLNWKAWTSAFILFRLFDIVKPPPVRQLEKLPGGSGIIADDVMAGIYAALVLYLAGCCNLY
jgi:phosphatidylglycerophosphatase A